MGISLKALSLIILAGLIGLAIAYSHQFTGEFFRIVGSRDEPGAWYGFWSGFGGSVPDIALITGATAWYVNHTCHDHPMCLRWGKYEAAGGLFKLCRRHHPDLGGERPDSATIHRLHKQHLERYGT